VHMSFGGLFFLYALQIETHETWGISRLYLEYARVMSPERERMEFRVD